MTQPAGSRKKRPARKSGGKAGKQAASAADSEPRSIDAPPKARDEAPLPPWGRFPLVQIAVFIGIVLLFVGIFTGNRVQMVVGLALGCLGGLEQVVREHFAGYRSHTTLLAGLVFVITVGLLYFWALLVLWLCLLIGVGLAGCSAWLFLKQFEKVSGGLKYRVR